ncbi:AAA family ATPase [Leeia sp. TBRC 13508]|uniref:DNA 3'-5' helicase II n=1 Tax=Leeia speluncae TaxID=2884804 RepID=A0ABS8D7D2_9NEIS|nr:3'-5' exonuclease [Leeia speluncae]MCB6183943.1 AAA family ATPase [Leeia speluncae]
MATLIPNLNSSLGRMTNGEKRFARRLESLLEEDYLCWYDVTVGVKRRRPDFLILNPHRGLLALEVKDWKRDSILRIDPQLVEANFNGKLVKEPNPLLKARDFIQVTGEALKADPLLCFPPDSKYAGKLCMPYGHGVVLPNITRSVFDQSGLAEVLTSHLVICQDEMTESVEAETFQQRLWQMFSQPFRCMLTLPQIDRIRWRLFPDVRISAHQGSLFESATQIADASALPELVRVMDIQQEQLARSLGEGHRVIHGVAGSGKTMILGYRAEYLAKTATKPILILCFNRALAQKLSVWMAEKGLSQNVVVRTFHRWCQDMQTTYQLAKPPAGDGYYDALVQTVIDGVNQKQVPAGQYSALLVDEGHDFQPEWFRLIVQMVDPDSNALMVLYDSAQDIYQKRRKNKFSFASVGIQAVGRTTILKLNYRNTAEVLAVAHAFASEVMTPEEASEDGTPLVSPETAGRHGPVPEFIQLPTFNSEVRYLADRFTGAHADGLRWEDMAVLAYSNRHLDQILDMFKSSNIPVKKDQTDAGVSLLTLHSSKGLEFPLVGIAGIGELPYASHDAAEQARVLYVGMTRAMDQLVMTSSKESEFSEKVRAVCSSIS